jgi:hypothetical protein
MTLSDYIDIGVFTGKKDEEKPLYLRIKKSLSRIRPLRFLWTICLPARA